MPIGKPSTARLVDAEGDISSVYIECAALDIKGDLDYNVLDKVFEQTFLKSELGLESLRQVVGYDFDLVVVDKFGYKFILGQERVARVISDVIELVSPNNSETVDQDVTLKWLHFDPGFEFSFHAKVRTDDDFAPELIWEQKGIVADTNSVVAHLPKGMDYIWEVWCVDKFNNQARSKQGSFKVSE